MGLELFSPRGSAGKPVLADPMAAGQPSLRPKRLDDPSMLGAELVEPISATPSREVVF
jgi:hypothetical protein